jgi:hypothetical protein
MGEKYIGDLGMKKREIEVEVVLNDQTQREHVKAFRGLPQSHLVGFGSIFLEKKPQI